MITSDIRYSIERRLLLDAGVRLVSVAMYFSMVGAAKTFSSSNMRVVSTRKNMTRRLQA